MNSSTSSCPQIYAGARSPESVLVQVTRDPFSIIDFRTATAASLLVQGPDGFEATWAGTIATGPLPPAATPQSLFVVHAFVAGDVDLPGRYVIVPFLTVPGGVVRGDPTELEVLPQFGKRRPRATPAPCC